MALTRPRRRTSEKIVADMISASLPGSRKTKIMNAASLNAKQVNRYIAILLEEGLLMLKRTDHIYLPTVRGREFLRTFERYEQTLDLLLEQRKAMADLIPNHRSILALREELRTFAR